MHKTTNRVIQVHLSKMVFYLSQAAITMDARDRVGMALNNLYFYISQIHKKFLSQNPFSENMQRFNNISQFQRSR